MHTFVTLGAEIAGNFETHDATQIEGGCGKELGAKARDYYWGMSFDRSHCVLSA